MSENKPRVEKRPRNHLEPRPCVKCGTVFTPTKSNPRNIWSYNRTICRPCSKRIKDGRISCMYCGKITKNRHGGRFCSEKCAFDYSLRNFDQQRAMRLTKACQ